MAIESETDPLPELLRVVKGNPDDSELAALTAVLFAIRQQAAQDTTATTRFRRYYPRYRAAGSWRTR
ncbi:hypothetical protein JOF56_007488 [Kibdelosporangium banguiense]|uniref:Acyl-CoA carboxylase subunit epsilon n=1 Tax=Kibdelosporangium banguiense TaxID=1365924 RepID=A0ABS4TRS9_9PSEU|nr:acyl-CoA carboxylase subunit epsilon [Kibdelosporangium banguiense]MBP2327103.1 hypothetical protein [Kibdelosporangium banguiense]